MQSYRVLLAAGLLAAGAVAPLAAQPMQPGVQVTLTPYLWLPSVDGTLRYGPPPNSSGVRSTDVEVDQTSLLEALNFAAMLAGEVRYRRFSLLADLIYLDLGNADSKVRSVDFVQVGSNPVSSSLNAGTESSLRGALATLAGGYTVVQGSWGHLDLQAGLRYFGVSARTDVRLGAVITGPGGGQEFQATSRAKRRADVVDGILGTRGRLALGAGFHIPFDLDVGTGSSRLTWQAATGIGYQTGWAGVTLGYRHLFYDQGSDKLLQDFSLGGPFLAGSFRF